MSRMGKVPIIQPDGVTVTLTGPNHVAVKGPKGELGLKFSPLVNFRREDNKFWVDRVGESRRAKAQQGLVHKLVNNMITGVTVGFKKELEIIGVGYRAAIEGKELVMTLGYSHPVRYAVPPDVQIKVDKNTLIMVEGIDKQRVGQTAAEIRAFRPPEPYKGKGVRYTDEYVVRKEAKKK